MSDHSDEIADYEERNYSELIDEFIDKYGKLWYEFVSEKYFRSEGI